MNNQPKLRLARAYVVIQKYNTTYSPEIALVRGTIFPELYFPYQRGEIGNYE
jgi:hypothetical protein